MDWVADPPVLLASKSMASASLSCASGGVVGAASGTVLAIGVGEAMREVGKVTELRGNEERQR